MKQILAWLCALTLLVGPVTPALASAPTQQSLAPTPCDPAALQVFENLLKALKAAGLIYITGGNGTDLYFTVPAEGQALETLLTLARTLGLDIKTQQGFTAFLEYLGFGWRGGDQTFSIYQRSSWWNKDRDGCGPTPPALLPAANPHPQQEEGTEGGFGEGALHASLVGARIALALAVIAAVGVGLSLRRRKAYTQAREQST